MFTALADFPDPIRAVRFLLHQAFGREAEWNERLRCLTTDAQEQCDQQRIIDQKVLDEKSKAARSSAGRQLCEHMERPSDLAPRPQADGAAFDRGRDPDQGRTDYPPDPLQAVHLPNANAASAAGIRDLGDDPEIVQLIDKLIDEHTDKQIANILNGRGYHSGKGGSFTPQHRHCSGVSSTE